MEGSRRKTELAEANRETGQRCPRGQVGVNPDASMPRVSPWQGLWVPQEVLGGGTLALDTKQHGTVRGMEGRVFAKPGSSLPGLLHPGFKKRMRQVKARQKSSWAGKEGR